MRGDEMKVQCNDQRMFLRAISSVSSCHRDIHNPHNTEGVLYTMIVDTSLCRRFFSCVKQLHRRRNLRIKFCRNFVIVLFSYEWQTLLS